MNQYFAFTNFGFAFDKKKLFENVTIDLDLSKITLLSGFNGSGKTTLCRILSGLNNDYSGSVKFFDRELKELNIIDISKQIVFIKQEPRGNVILTTPDEDLRIWQTAFHLADNDIFIKEREAALESTSMLEMKNTPLWELSNGQLKRVGLSGLLLNTQKYWILDEPLTGLDQKLIDQFLLMLEKHKENGCGALIVSHRTNHFKKIIDIELTIKNKKILEKS